MKQKKTHHYCQTKVQALRLNRALSPFETARRGQCPPFILWEGRTPWLSGQRHNAKGFAKPTRHFWRCPGRATVPTATKCTPSSTHTRPSGLIGDDKGLHKVHSSPLAAALEGRGADRRTDTLQALSLQQRHKLGHGGRRHTASAASAARRCRCPPSTGAPAHRRGR